MNNLNRITKVGVFYDGNYFFHVSNYYRYSHERKSRIDISGLHDFIIKKVEEKEKQFDSNPMIHITDAHYFRGRLSAQEASDRDKLFFERQFDDILMNENIVTHFLPVVNNSEKGIDVWFALEAYELAFLKKFSVIVLIAGDSDFVPLVRKLNALGVRVMLLSWDFNYVDSDGTKKVTKTSQRLISECSYPILMQNEIEDYKNTPLINDIFIIKRSSAQLAQVPLKKQEESEKRIIGKIFVLKEGEGYGYISHKDYPSNLFFHFTDVLDDQFNELWQGQDVSFVPELQTEGPHAGKSRAKRLRPS